jgi:short-subunit dehydrogenase
MAADPGLAPKRTALITGASSGIGAAFCDEFAAHGYDLVVTARREDRLRDLAARLERQHGVRVHVVVDDLADPAAPERLVHELAARGLVIDALVNNAGYGMTGVYTGSEWRRHADFLQVMVVAVAELAHRLVPGMVERGHGRIINVASLAGLSPAPAGHTLYAASKAFVIKFSEALAHEVRRHGVHVTAVCPGFTLSEFHDVNGMRASVSKLPSFLWMDAATVAKQGYAAVEEGIPIYVNGRVNRVIAALVRYLPYRILTAGAKLTAGSYRKA